jgi:ATP-dependent exoDNAse (exonuclease V) alpha subunit
MEQRYNEGDYFRGRLILCPLKSQVRKYNKELLEKFPGKDVSIKIMKKEKEITFHLKIGCPLLCTKNNRNGLANGDRLVLEEVISNSLIKVKVLTGILVGKSVELRQTTVNGSYRFPVSYGFATTVHKSQGQTLEWVGVDYTADPFCHGMLYTSLTRVHGSSCIKIMSKTKKIENPLNSELLKKCC